MRDLINNPLNPYATNWPNSFLKKGFQLGLRYNTIHFGVPSLRIKQLNKKIFLPPVYKVKYNQYTDNNKNLKTTEDIVTYYNKDKTIKSLNLYLNLKVKSEAEIMEEYKKKIINELNLIKKEKKKMKKRKKKKKMKKKRKKMMMEKKMMKKKMMKKKMKIKMKKMKMMKKKKKMKIKRKKLMKMIVKLMMKKMRKKKMYK